MRRTVTIAWASLLAFSATLARPTGAVEVERLVLDEDFADLGGLYVDVSALPCYLDGGSIFQSVAAPGSPTGRALTIQPQYVGNFGPWPQQAAAAADFRFPQPLRRADGEIRIEWSLKVDEVGLRENNRFLLIALTGMDRKSDLSTVTEFTQGPYTAPGQEYGRPTYHVRVKAGTGPDQMVRLCYGQEIERQAGTGSYLPGFISPYGPTGTGDWSSPNKLKKVGQAMPAADTWYSLSWRIGPTYQSLWQDGEPVRTSVSADIGTKESGCTYAGPTEAMPAALAELYPDYEHFPAVEGLRLFMRNANAASRTWVGHLRVTQTVDAVPGDADLDGDVDLDDYVAARDHFGHPGQWGQGDFNLDGWVDYLDYVSIKRNFGLGTPPAEPDPPGTRVPEPAALFLLAAAAPIVCRRRARRAGSTAQRRAQPQAHGAQQRATATGAPGTRRSP